MKGSPKEDITAAKNILHLASKGHFFEQNWAQVPENDKQVIELVKEDHAHHVILEEDSWRGMKKCCPIISGGLNPTKLKLFIDIMGEVDFITTMGAGCHAHPKGTNSGANTGLAIRKDKTRNFLRRLVFISYNSYIFIFMFVLGDI